MGKRLGDVCYWIGLALTAVAYGAFLLKDGVKIFSDKELIIGVIGFGLPMLIGWAVRYITTGRKDWNPAPTD